MSLRDNYDNVLDLADNVYAAQRKPAAVAAAKVVEEDDTEVDDVAAVGRGRAQRGRRPYRGRGRGQSRGRGQGNPGGTSHQQPQQQQQQQQQQQKSGGGNDLCYVHRKFGSNAYFCDKPSSCPMNNITATPPQTQ